MGGGMLILNGIDTCHWSLAMQLDAYEHWTISSFKGTLNSFLNLNLPECANILGQEVIRIAFKAWILYSFWNAPASAGI